VRANGRIHAFADAPNGGVGGAERTIGARRVFDQAGCTVRGAACRTLSST
jgi:hypothetical protein